MKSRQDLEQQFAQLKLNFTGEIDNRLGTITQIKHKDGKALRHEVTQVTQPKTKIQSTTKKEELAGKSTGQKAQLEKLEKQRIKREERHQRQQENLRQLNAEYVLIEEADKSKIVTKDNTIISILKSIIDNLKSVDLNSQSLAQYRATLETHKNSLEFDKSGAEALPSLELIEKQIAELDKLQIEIARIEAEEARQREEAERQKALQREIEIQNAQEEERQKAAEIIRLQKLEEERRQLLENQMRQQALQAETKQPSPSVEKTESSVEASAADQIFSGISAKPPKMVIVPNKTSTNEGDGERQPTVVVSSAGSVQPVEDSEERKRAADQFDKYALHLRKTDWGWLSKLLSFFNEITTQEYKARKLIALALTIRAQDNDTYKKTIKDEAESCPRLVQGRFFSHNTRNLLTNAANGQSIQYTNDPTKVKNG